MVPVTPALSSVDFSGFDDERRRQCGRCRQDDDRGGGQEGALDEHADVIREAVRARRAGDDGVRGVRADRRRARRASARGPSAASQGLIRPGGVTRRAGELEMQIARSARQLLAELPGTASALRAGARPRRPAGLCLRSLDAPRRPQLVEGLGLRISRSEVSRVCQALDEHVEAFRSRPLEGRYPYLFLDAKVEKVRDGGRVVNKALVVAHASMRAGGARSSRLTSARPRPKRSGLTSSDAWSPRPDWRAARHQ
jgi:hypothetical protein